MKRIYLFNIVAWNCRKKIGFPVCKKENFAGLQAHRKRGKSASASTTPHHTLNEERSARSPNLYPPWFPLSLSRPFTIDVGEDARLNYRSIFAWRYIISLVHHTKRLKEIRPLQQVILTVRHLHILTYPQKLCISIVFNSTREGYAKFWRANKVHHWLPIVHRALTGNCSKPLRSFMCLTKQNAQIMLCWNHQECSELCIYFTSTME